MLFWDVFQSANRHLSVARLRFNNFPRADFEFITRNLGG